MLKKKIKTIKFIRERESEREERERERRKTDRQTEREETRGDRNRPPTRPHAQDLKDKRVRGNPSLRSTTQITT